MRLFSSTLSYSASLFMATTFKGLMGRSFTVNPQGTPRRYSGKLAKKTRIREFDQLKTVLALNAQETEQHHSQPSHQKLKTMVKRCTDQKIRARNFEARDR